MKQILQNLKVKLSKALKYYDQKCEELGLLPGQKRSCVPYKSDSDSSTQDKAK